LVSKKGDCGIPVGFRRRKGCPVGYRRRVLRAAIQRAK